MSDHRQRDRDNADQLASDDELARALLDWPAKEPPARFAESVLAELDAQQAGLETREAGLEAREAGLEAREAGLEVREAGQPASAPGRSQARWPALAAAAAAAAVLTFGASWWLGDPPRDGAPPSDRGGPSTGEHVADTRATLSLGRRAVAVAEAGSALAWREADDGATRVEQRRGEVFYRVARGERPFAVHTPVGRVRVLGTCFTVEVLSKEVVPMGKRSRAGLAGAAAGAAAASVVLVTVYEGKVQLLTAEPRAKVELGPGQAARAVAGKQPRRIDRQQAAATKVAAARRGATPALASSAPTNPVALARENQTLRQQLGELQQALAKAQKGDRENKVLDLSKEELRAMAKRCELRWDHPGLATEPPKAPEKAVRELGLNDTERAAVDKVLARYHTRMITALRALYIEVTGDRAGADALSPAALKREIADKSPRADVKRTFSRLARERAGLQAPPPAGSEQIAIERLYRLLIGAGDRVERELGAEIGPDLARRARELNGGWGSRSRASYGCP